MAMAIGLERPSCRFSSRHHRLNHLTPSTSTLPFFPQTLKGQVLLCFLQFYSEKSTLT